MTNISIQSSGRKAVAIICYALGPMMFSVLPVVVNALVERLIECHEGGNAGESDDCGTGPAHLVFNGFKRRNDVFVEGG